MTFHLYAQSTGTNTFIHLSQHLIQC